MWKFIKRLILLCLLIAILITGYIGFEGYSMYKKAIFLTSLDKKIEEIQNSDSYTKLDDIPKIYQNAVIAVEDHRFKEHNRI